MPDNQLDAAQLVVAHSATFDRHAPRGAAALASLVTDAWPRSSRPTPLPPLTIRGLIEALEWPDDPSSDADPVGRSLSVPNTVAIVCWNGTESLTEVAELADHLHRTRMPAVFAVQRCDAAWLRFEHRALLVHPMDAEPAVLAAAVHALSHQAEVVAELKTELHASSVSQGGIAGQMHRIHEELNIAATLQRGLLPVQPPEIGSLDLGVIFRPAAYVSGDFFQLTELPDGRLAFLLADAVGHGVPAALLTMLIHSAVTKAKTAPGGPSSPADTLATINDALASACPEGSSNTQFATAVFGLFEPSSGTVTISNAGHPPPLRFGASSSSMIQPHGPLLGVFPGVAFEEELFVLSPGETLLLYSDGFEVAFPEPGSSQPASDEYLRHFDRFGMTISESGDLARGIRLIEQALDAHEGSLHQHDDVTAIALHRRPDAADHRAAA